jgi:hypothetical protein
MLASAEDTVVSPFRLPHMAVKQMRTWFNAHYHHPFPTLEDKKQFEQYGIMMSQINRWFSNERRKWRLDLQGQSGFCETKLRNETEVGHN